MSDKKSFLEKRMDSLEETVKNRGQKKLEPLQVIFEILALFIVSLLVSFFIFGIVDTYDFIVQTNITPFWFTTIILFAILVAILILGIAIGRRM